MPKVQWWAGRIALLSILACYFFTLRLYSDIDLGTEWVDGDVGQRVAQAERMMQGQLPYRDFWAHYPPMPYYTNLFLFRVFGVELSSFRLGLALVGTLTSFLTYVITRRVASRFAAIVALLLTASWSVLNLNINYNTWYCLPPVLLALWGSLVGVHTRARWPWLIAGLAAGLVLSYKVNFGVVTILMVGLSAIARSGAAESRGMSLLRNLLLIGAGISGLALTRAAIPMMGFVYFVIPMAAVSLLTWRLVKAGSAEESTWFLDLVLATTGILIVQVPWLAYFSAQWTAADYLRTVFIDFITYGESVSLELYLRRARPLVFYCFVCLGFWSALKHRKGVAGAAFICALGTLITQNESTGFDGLVFNLVKHWVHARSVLPAILLPAALVYLAVFEHDPNQRRTLLVLTIAASAVLLTYYPYSDVNHLQWAWPPLAILTCVLLERLATSRPTRLPLIFVSALAGIHSVHLYSHFYRPGEDSMGLEKREFARAAPPRGDVLVPVNRASAIAEATAAVRRTPADAPVLELYGHFLGFLGERRNAVRYDYFWPGWLNEAEQHELVDAVRKDPPSILIGHKLGPEDEPLDRFREMFPVFGEYLTQAYRPVQIIGPYQFYGVRPAAARDSAMASSNGANHSNGVRTSPKATSGLASP